MTHVHLLLYNEIKKTENRYFPLYTEHGRW